MKNSLIENNPTVLKLRQFQKLKRKRKENILSMIVFWSMIVGASYAGNANVNTDHKTESVHKQKPMELVVYKPTNSKKLTLIQKDTTKYNTTQNYHISARGMAFIKEMEGFSAQGYWDSNSVTIGWGHKINSDDPLWLQNKHVGDWISHSDADKLFEKDIRDFINPSLKRMEDDMKYHHVMLTQGMIDGIASMIYNCGEYGLKSTEFYRLLKAGHVNTAIKTVTSTKISEKGHIERRKKEQQLMMI